MNERVRKDATGRRFWLTAAIAGLPLLTSLSACSLTGAVAPIAEVATCPSDDEVAELMRRFVALQPATNPPDSMTVDGGVCGRDKFNRLLAQHYGAVVGYKAGLTHSAVQRRFNHPGPVRGSLYGPMLLRDSGEGVEVPARFGARPLLEADLVVEVRSSAIHSARTPEEVMNHISVIYPFIELPDLVVEDPSKLGGAAITFINVGARLGVLGRAVFVPPEPQARLQLAAALRDMTVRLVDANGRELDSAKGSAILEHPLNAAIWLADDLRKAGVMLKSGDLLSLGSFSRLVPQSQANGGATAIYEGLPTRPSVSVRFR